jgi:hypothetical protein
MKAMRIAAVVTIAIVMASPAALADIKRHASIPDALLGSWAPTADDCKGDGKSVIMLAAKDYSSADMKCSVDWVSETAGPDGPIYSARMRCTRPPAKSPSITNLIMRPGDATRISVGPDFNKLATYQKCGAKQ